MKHYTIYQTTNIIDGKIYIGMHETTDPNDGYLGSGKHLKLAIKKYGRDSFRKNVLFVFSTETEMREKEAELVTEEFCSRSDTYNICPGGKGGFGYLNNSCKSSRLGFRWSSESRKKLSEAMSGHKVTDETRHKMSSNNGMRRKDTKEKLSRALTGRTLSEEHRRRVSESIKKWHQQKRGIDVVEA